MGSIKDRNGRDLTEAEDVKKRWKEYTEELYKKDLHDPWTRVYGILQARILEWAAFPFSRGSSKPRAPALQADSLPAEPQGKPMVYEVNAC